MYELRVSAMAVVDEAGRLTGNLSASDLRCLAPGLFAALLLPVEEYLSKRPLLQRAQEELRAVRTTVLHDNYNNIILSNYNNNNFYIQHLIIIIIIIIVIIIK
jgi:CBS domain-containing protein